MKIAENSRDEWRRMYQESEVKHGEVIENLLKKEREEDGNMFISKKSGKWKKKYEELYKKVKGVEYLEQEVSKLKKTIEDYSPSRKWIFMKKKNNVLEEKINNLKKKEEKLRKEKEELTNKDEGLEMKNSVLEKEILVLKKKIKILL